jgi:hypothetical protein
MDTNKEGYIHFDENGDPHVVPIQHSDIKYNGNGQAYLYINGKFHRYPIADTNATYYSEREKYPDSASTDYTIDSNGGR